jgi:hypothetical protein
VDVNFVCLADLLAPFGVLDLIDINAFVQAFLNQEPPADLAAPIGVFDLADIGTLHQRVQHDLPVRPYARPRAPPRGGARDSAPPHPHLPEPTMRRSPASLLSLSALLLGAHAATGGVPQDWDIELVCRSSLDPNILAFRLPQGSSLSSQYVSLDEQGNVAIRVFLSGSPSEAVFYGNTGFGRLALVGTSPDPIWSVTVETRDGLIAVEDGTFGPGGASVFDSEGDLVERYDLGLVGVDSLAGVAPDAAIGYRAAIGLAGQGIVLDRFESGNRQQDILLSTLDIDDDVDFILSPEMNASKQFVANTLPLSGPSRRIVRLSPDGTGGYLRETVAETGGQFNAFVNSTAIAPDGAVAFNARRAGDSVWQVTRSDEPGEPLATIAEGGQMGIVNSNLANFPPVVNSGGLVAFRVEDSAGSTALFVGDGTGGPDSLVRIVGNGDTAQTDLGPIPFGFDFGGTPASR